jgi:hypothetical protein
MKGGMHAITSREEVLASTSNGFERGMDQNHWHLSFPIRMGDNEHYENEADPCKRLGE